MRFKLLVRKFLYIILRNRLFYFIEKREMNITENIGKLSITYSPWTDIGLSLYLKNKFEQDEMSMMESLLKDGSVVLDVGANIGYLSLLFSQNNKVKTVLSIEPSPQTFRTLLKNIHGHNNILALNVGFSETNGLVDFFIAVDNAYSGLKDTKRKEIIDIVKVPVFKGDDYLKLLNIEKIDFIKMDVEGFEHSALKGLEETIIRNKPAMHIEIYSGKNSNLNPEETIKYVVQLGYDAYILKDGKLQPYSCHDDKYYSYFFTPKAILFICSIFLWLFH
ncbi:MAG: FkbM family methyltransferase [Ignavibacteria bacterium]